MNKYECVQCGNPCRNPFSLCDNCLAKAVKEKEDYLKYLLDKRV